MHGERDLLRLRAAAEDSRLQAERHNAVSLATNTPRKPAHGQQV